MLWPVTVAAIVCSATSPDIKVDSLAALRDAARTARPGDRIVLAPGIYKGTLTLDGVKGEKNRPLVIMGGDPKNPPVIRGGSEGVHLSRPAYVTLKNLVIEQATGNGLNIDDGGDRTALAPGVILENIHVRDIGEGCGEGRAGKGNCDGIKLSGLTGFDVRLCRVERWGAGGSGIDMVGCHDGTVRGSTFRHDDPGPTTAQQQGASAIQMKGGTRKVIVLSCVFEHAGQRAVNIGGSTGTQYFRPPLPQGESPRSEAADITVEGCTFAGGDAAAAFVGVDGAVFRYNTVYLPRRWALRILQETRLPGFVPCRNGAVSDNIFVLQGRPADAINIGDATDAKSFAFARNVWYWGPDAGAAAPRLPSQETAGVYGRDPELRDPGHGDFMPARGGPGANAGAGATPKPK